MCQALDRWACWANALYRVGQLNKGEDNHKQCSKVSCGLRAISSALILRGDVVCLGGRVVILGGGIVIVVLIGLNVAVSEEKGGG